MLAERPMLVLSSFHGHTSEEVKDRLLRNGTDLFIILDETASISEPLDVSFNRPFKAHVNQESHHQPDYTLCMARTLHFSPINPALTCCDCCPAITGWTSML